MVWTCIVLLWLVALVYLLYNLRLQWAATWLPAQQAPDSPLCPNVTIQVPLYNEGEVVAPLFEAILRLDYPCDRLQIQILDDSTDTSADYNRAWVENARREGVDVAYLHRGNREGYKAGALQAALPSATGELLCLLDADFHPRPDFLKRMVRWFADPRLAFAQARWDVSNGGASFSARLAQYWVQQHFEFDQPARSKLGAFMHFNGTAGVWRKQAIVDGGGWSSATLAEDFDLSLRVWFLRRYTVVYDSTTSVPSLVPETMRALKIQQARWATGSFQVLVRHLRPMVCAPWPENLTLLLHASGYLFGPSIMLLALLSGPAALLAAANSTAHYWLCELPGFVFLALAFAQIAELAYRRGWRVSVRQFYYLTLGLGLSPWILRHLWRGLWLRGGEFVRTPKGRYRADTLREYYALAVTELLAGAVCLSATALCAVKGLWGSSYLPLIVGVGLVYVGIQSLRRETRV